MSEPCCCEAYLEETNHTQTRTFALQAGEVCRIGRDELSSIVLVDNQVSRHHAMIHGTPAGEYYLSDLGSRNGTLLNHRPITGAALLRAGDRIGIGKHELVFHDARNAARAGKAPEPKETVAIFDQQLVTVMVADIRDFTGLSRRMDETRLSQILSAFMRETGAALALQKAWRQKYIGDAVMALWAHERNAPELAEVLCVFSGIQCMFQIAAGLQAQFNLDEPIRIGVGVNTGLACLGNMGSDAAADYTALSEAVNRAFRLESTTKESGWDLALGPRTYEFLRDAKLGSDGFQEHLVALKGYPRPQPVYGGSRADVRTVIENIERKLLGGATAVLAGEKMQP